MYIKNPLIHFLIIFVINQISYAGNNCPKWFPLPTDDLVVVIPIYDESITEPDLDCDGIIDTVDPDIDGDGILNSSDTFPLNPGESVDTDGDGIGNNADTDDDNDGYSDIEEIAAGSNPLDANDIPMVVSNKRIFILGSSTVHAGWWHSLDFNDVYGNNRVLEGWGEQLARYMINPDKVYNRALSGSCSVWYRDPDSYMDAGYLARPGNTGKDWNSTEELIVDMNDSHGGFLLVQFGAREAYTASISVEDFENELRAYVADANRLGLTPVLISPPGSRSHGTNTRPYAQYIEPIAVETGALFIDLYEKSKAVWQTYDLVGGVLPQADIDFSYKERHGGINNTHFGRIGAKTVAGWVRELACDPVQHSYRSQAVQDAAVELCSQFVQGDLEHPIMMREDAEDGDTEGWQTYGTTDGATIVNEYDATKRSNVIVLQGDDGLDNGFRFSNANPWEEEDNFVLSWDMNYSEDFTFFVSVDTEDGYKIFEYKPNNNAPTIVSGRYRFGLGADVNNGTWHTFTRDIQADLKTLDSTKNILKIHRIAIRGSGRLDNIRTMSSIDVVSRDIAPTVATIGEAEIAVDKGSVYTDAGVTVVDDNDADIMTKLETIGSVDTGTVGTYTINYKVHDSVGNGGYATRTVHVVEPTDPDSDVVTVHEDAEDGNTVGWNTYGTTVGSTITNVEDGGSRVIELSGANGTDNGFSFSGLNITSGFVASWRLKYTDDFRFFVQVRSTNSPDSNIYMEYTPHDISIGLNGSYIHNGLGDNANDGIWHTFTRDVEADFNVVYPDDNITRIVGFSIRGSGRIDDINTSTRAPKETFTYNGHTYKIVKNALSWQDASDAAHADGGYLVNIGSIAENHEIYSRLNRCITDAEYAGTVASNGGNASYVWIGANDLDTEETWLWEDNDANFWLGGVGGASAGGLYNNWGRDVDETLHEPDNSGNQDAAAMAITGWQLGSGNLGQSSQWNDLLATDALYYIIEYDNQVEIVLNELKAFPTAEGAGANASGGRGGEVIYVTNRDADGNGSLRQALRTEGTRTIVFAIGGRFDLNVGINLGSVNNNVGENIYNNFTLAGQTAWNKGGVHLANNGDTSTWARHFNVYGQENMILRYFDTRFNWQWYVKDNASDQHPSIRFVNSSDFIIDHMTSGWSAYGLIVTNSFRNNYDKTIDNITVQRSLFHENIINPEATDQKNHNVGLLLGAIGQAGSTVDWNKIGHFSIHKNAFIGVSHRFPNTAGGNNARFDIINNYVQGFDGGGHKRLVRAGGNAHNDFRNNLYQETLYSPSFSPSNLIGFTYAKFIPDDFNPDEEAPNFHIDGNLFVSNNGQRLDITDTVQDSNGRDMIHLFDSPASMSNLPRLVLRDIPNSTPHIPVSILNANEVKDNILNNVGGNVKFSGDGITYVDNSIDNMYLDWAKNNDAPNNITSSVGDGGIGDQNRFIHPSYSTDLAVNLDTYDTDRDGIPNEWELAHNLDVNIKNNTTIRANRNWNIGSYRVINNAGYTDLEIYLADIAGDFHMLVHNN